MAKLPPLNLRDFSKGRYSKNAVSGFLAPENSVSSSTNINFDEIVGAAKVRPGTVKLGATVASGKTPLGLSGFLGKSGTPDYLLVVFQANTTSTSTSSSSSSSSTLSTSSSSTL